MVIVYFPHGSSGAPDSIDPGESNVVTGVAYQIDGTPHTGTFVNDFPTLDQIANAVWSEPMAGYTDTTTFGGYVRLKLLSVAKFLGLQ